jgi:hypothetical protein
MKQLFGLLAAMIPGPLAALHAAETWHQPRPALRCLYNIESLMHCNEDISAAKIKWVVEKLRGTDVDAIMCCPTAWRMNMFPSEVDPEWKKFTHIRQVPAFQPYDHVMQYIHGGGDPVRDQLEASRDIGADFFISYRLNDWHNIHDKSFPTHNAFWREHPECWLGDADKMGTSDGLRLFNYLMPAVREHYFAIIEELCTRYDLDGVELDFQRVPRFFHDDEIDEGRPVMTAFVRRIREMMDRIGKERGKHLRLCVRIPDCLPACEKAGLDVTGWDAAGWLDMVNVSSFFYHSMEIDLEGVKAAVRKAKVFGEMNKLYTQKVPPRAPGEKTSVNSHNATALRRATTFEMYRATAMNFLHRGADGVSLFNLDYVDGDCYNLSVSQLELPLKRAEMPAVLRGITDLRFLEGQSKHYAVYPNSQMLRPSFPAKDEKTLRFTIADDPAKTKFAKAVLRVETKEDSAAHRIQVLFNGHELPPCDVPDTELFEPIHRNAGFPTRAHLKFYSVPMEHILCGSNEIAITNRDKSKSSLTLFSLEVALYK